MVRLEHIGIAVKDLKESNALFERLLGAAPYKAEEVASEHVMTSFFKVGESKVELLEATAPESAIAKYIEKKGGHPPPCLRSGRYQYRNGAPEGGRIPAPQPRAQARR